MISPTNQQTPYRRLYRELHDAIVEKKLTGKLPSIATLAAQYQVNHNTVKKALAQLKEYRFIYGEQGKGCFVNPDCEVNILAQKFVTLYVHASLLLNPFYMQLIYALRTLLEVERCNVNLVNTQSQVKAFAGQTDVLVLFEQFQPDELARVLELIGPNQLVACNCLGPTGCRQVRTDNIAGGELAMQHLYGQGCRNIGVLGIGDIDDERSHFFLRRCGVRRFAEAHPEVKISEVTIPVEQLTEPISQYWIEDLYEKAGKPDAVFAFMDLLVFGIYRFMAERGVRFAVLGHDDRDFAVQLFPAMSSIREDVEQVAAATCRLIRDAIGQENPGRALLIPPRIITRASSKIL